MKRRKIRAPIYGKNFVDDVLGFDPDPTTGGGILGLTKKTTDPLEDLTKDLTGQTAEDESKAAAAKQADYQQRALDYLMQREQLPMEARDQALTGLQDIYLGGGRQGMIDDIKSDPFYQSQLAEAEQGALRGLSSMGLSRSGVVPATMSKIAPQLLENAYRERIGGISGLAGLQSNQNAIANQMSGIGSTLAMGDIAGAQARQAGIGNTLGLLTNIGSMIAFSDPKLKENVEVIGEYKGLPWCKWTWKENDLGLKGEGVGVMADDVAKKYPHLAVQIGDYIGVDYEGLMNG